MEAFRSAEGKRQDDFQWVVEIVIEVVEQHVTETSAGENADEAVGQEVLQELVIVGEAGFAAYAIAGEHVDPGEGHDVHEAVPLDAERPERQKHRIHVFRQMLPPMKKPAHESALTEFPTALHRTGKPIRPA